MPEYQLPIAGALAVTAVGSLVLLLGHPKNERKIQLPTHGEGDNSLLHDPFNVITPEDIIDGYPVDEERFWNKARLWKVVACLLLGVIVVLQTMALGWTFVVDDEDYSKYTYVLHSVYAFYVTILAGRAVYQNTVDAHATYIIHLATLTLVPTVLLFVVAVLPSSRPFSVDLAKDAPFVLWISYAVLALYSIITYIIFTIPMGPPLHFPPEAIYSSKTAKGATNPDQNNVCGIVDASVWSYLLFNYTTKVVMLGYTSESLEIGDLPIVPSNMRATYLYASMRKAIRTVKWRISCWKPKIGSGWQLGYQLLRVNILPTIWLVILAMVSACLFYTSPFFLKQVISYLESDPERRDRSWGWFYVTCMFLATACTYIVTGQLWSVATTTIQVRIRIQLNTVLFGKTLVRKDVASSSSTADRSNNGITAKDDEDDFSSKAQIMTLMTTDVDRVSDFSWHMFSLVDSPIEIIIGTIFLYSLLGVSCFIGLAVTCLFLPLNHFGGKVVVRAQENLMKTRDERVALMNEILGAIRMLKFMAWERSFERKVLAVRDKELRYQKLSYMIEVLFNAIWDGSPIFVTIVAFWHFSVVRGQTLTPSIAFTSILVFNEMKFALNALPETFINMLQSFVSLRRIEKYMNAAEVTLVPPLSVQTRAITFQNATITWPQDRIQSGSATPSAASTPRHKFMLLDLAISFPQGKLSLVCGKLGSGKTLLLLALLGEADILAGQVVCPRSPPDSLAQFAGQVVTPEEWVVDGVCAYVPQSAWLRNASIKDNILFNLPYDEERYQKTLEACALVSDLLILEDGDASEIGERGVNLSGGQKARVSLARAVYSRASVLFLDDVLSAVDAHTAHHLYHQCLMGDLIRGRTVILVSHHVQLCMSGASYIVALDNGRVIFQGDKDTFEASNVVATLVHSGDDDAEEKDKDVGQTTEAILADASSHAAPVLVGEEVGNVEMSEATAAVTPTETEPNSETSSTAFTPEEVSKADRAKDRKAPRKLIEEERRAVGHIKREIWEMYIGALGGWKYWSVFVVALILGALSPVLENWWLKMWSGADPVEAEQKGPVFYITVYAAVTLIGLFLNVFRFYVLYTGSINASTVLYKRLLETILFADIRFHDTVSRGRLLNRFGKDFEGIDSKTANNFGRSIFYGLAALTTVVTVSVVGGIPFICAGILLGYMYYSVAKVYGQTARDMRRLDSVTRSPLYSIYGETIAGVTILRAFGASSMFLRDMIRCVDTNANPYYWMWGVNRWLSTRFNLLSCALVGLTGFVAVLSPSISAALAGFALTFASNVTHNLLFLVRRFVGLEQSMVALERVKEYSELKREPAEFIMPRPDSDWPKEGHIKCEDLVIRYAPDLPDVLHHINFEVMPGEKVGILGRTGSGKSTLALSFFRFVEATEGRIVIDGVDISKIGLTDLRGKLTIIPRESSPVDKTSSREHSSEDPTILSGTLRSTLDVFDEYTDAEIFEALRRVHLIPSEDSPEETPDTINANVFRNLDSAVSEGGENFSTGEKQLLCMARAILKRSRVLVMDEATASVDYATDELISKTIRHEFATSTILTIAHRLRTVIDYDRVMILDTGRIVEFDRPATLLADPNSNFYRLCKAAGRKEFSVLKKMAGAA
ncbi:P-loop containing nucleoside triphosphate hydrolase protein [Pisolithus marmoratus]|nr:P-loop containing nucleoside triphosphate hydrolase protein [Pisolithus marmoratus]